MADEGKRFPATPLKLQTLRRAGIVPFSRDVMVFAVLLGSLLGASWILAGPGKSLVELTQNLLAASDPGAAQEQFSSAGRVLFRLCVVFFTATLAAVLLAGGLQTRFLISFGLWRPGFGRFFPLGFPGQGLFSRLAGGLLDAAKTAAWLAAGLLLIGYLVREPAAQRLPSPQIFSRLKHTPAAAAPAYEPGKNQALLGELQFPARLQNARYSLLHFWAGALCFSFFAGAISRFVTVLRFRREHQMTRAELEAEYRESEASPEMRGAMRDLQRGR